MFAVFEQSQHFLGGLAFVGFARGSQDLKVDLILAHQAMHMLAVTQWRDGVCVRNGQASEDTASKH